MQTTPAAAFPDEGAFIHRLTQKIGQIVRNGDAPNLHGLVVLHGDETVYEWYGAGEDFKWNDSLGHVTFGAGTLHDIRSVTKSIVALLYGIALANGQAPEVDEPLAKHFPQYADLWGDPGHARLTVRHALTMSLGLKWNEDVPYTSLENSEIAMEFAADRYRYILEQPIVSEPGVAWRYSGGATALIGHLIERGTGRSLPDYAREMLFTPLGIQTFEWMAGTDGVASAASGLRLSPRHLGRIGQLVLSRGAWRGKQVVPQEWIDAALQPRIEIAPGFEYGYQWYIGTLPGKEPGQDYTYRWWGGIGNGDQRLWLVPELQLVIAMTAGNYNQRTTLPETILRTIVQAGAMSDS